VQPDRKQTAATFSLSFSSKELRNWLKERRVVEEERWINGGGEQAVVAGKLSSKGKGIQVSKVGHSNTGSAGNILVIYNRTLRINSRSVDQREIRERESERNP
jgi:hypothetical protein